jgi:DNA-directed RNA polymerase III subunit RPC3
VDLRNQQLAKFAAEALGETTGQVYHALLRMLTTKTSRCRPDPRIDIESGDSDDNEQRGTQSACQAKATTLDVFESLDPSVNVLSGIGKASRDLINFKSAEKVRPEPPQLGIDSDDPDAEVPATRTVSRAGLGEDDGSNSEDIDDDEDGDDDEDDIMTIHGRKPAGRTTTNQNGPRETKVKFDEEVTLKDSRLEAMRQHLLLLSESKHRFVRHCGTLSRGQWTVDFEQVVESLRQGEIDAVIEQSFGRHGLRLTRILRDKGKLDDKALPLLALMKKSDVQTKMLAMQVAGIVDVQEVPRDITHKARNTMHLRFFDEARTKAHLLDNLYKAMLRCLQTLEVQRYEERNILSFVDRKDVKGKEEEVMTAEHYNKYHKHLDLQDKLLGQVMRLDEIVAIIRDY